MSSKKTSKDVLSYAASDEVQADLNHEIRVHVKCHEHDVKQRALDKQKDASLFLSFTEEEARKVPLRMLKKNAAVIAEWLNGHSESLKLKGRREKETVGRTYHPDGSSENDHGFVLVLSRTEDNPFGVCIKTFHPIPDSYIVPEDESVKPYAERVAKRTRKAREKAEAEAESEAEADSNVFAAEQERT